MRIQILEESLPPLQLPPGGVKKIKFELFFYILKRFEIVLQKISLEVFGIKEKKKILNFK